MKTLKIKDKILVLGKKTLIMGILNVTPDSFSDGGHHNTLQKTIERANVMYAQGADIIDIGGESTRPGAIAVAYREEKQRVLPVVEALAKSDMLLSVDTTKAKIADAALNLGAHIINDVWGFQRDLDMASVAAQYNAVSVLMHNKQDSNYSGDIITSILSFFDKSISIATRSGLDTSRIILDPGIGFGKTAWQNIEVLRRLDELVAYGFPLLLGTSRKSTIGLILDLPVNQRLEGTLATTALGIKSGVDIVRVHDVLENKRTAQVADAIVRGNAHWIE